jgi:hypothetical protein
MQTPYCHARNNIHKVSFTEMVQRQSCFLSSSQWLTTPFSKSQTPCSCSLDLVSSKSQFPAWLGSTFGPTLNTCSRKTNNLCLMLECSPPSWFCAVQRQCRTHMVVGPGTCLGPPADVVSAATVPPDRDVAGSADCHDAPYQCQGTSYSDRRRGAPSELWIEVIWFLWL